MPYATFTATPINGGSFNVDSPEYTRLSATRHVYTIRQSTPDAIIGTVVDITNPKSASPTLTVVNQEVLILPNLHANSAARVFAINENHLVAVYMSTVTSKTVFQIVRVEENGTFTTLPISSGLMTSTGAVTLRNLNAIDYDFDSYLDSPGTLYFTANAAYSGSSKVALFKVTFNGSTITATDYPTNYSVTAGSGYSTSTKFVKDVTTGDLYFLAKNKSTNISDPVSYYWTQFYKVTPTGLESRTITSNAVGFLPTGTESGMWLLNSKEFKYAPTLSANWGSSPTTSFATNKFLYTYGHGAILDMYALGNDHYAFFTDTGMSSSGDGRNILKDFGKHRLSLRIFKFVDQNYGLSSPSTDSTTGENGAILPLAAALIAPSTNPNNNSLLLGTSFDRTNNTFFLPFYTKYLGTTTNIHVFGMQTVWV